MRTTRFDVRVGRAMLGIEIDGEHGPRLAGTDELASIVRVDDSTFSVMIRGRSYTIRVRHAGNAYIMSSGGLEVRTEAESDRSLLLKRAGAATGRTEHGTTIAAPMPALVVRLEVEPGQEVAIGQGLVVLEAMKMENEIRSPRAGKVKSIPAVPGKPVEKGEALVILE